MTDERERLTVEEAMAAESHRWISVESVKPGWHRRPSGWVGVRCSKCGVGIEDDEALEACRTSAPEEEWDLVEASKVVSTMYTAGADLTGVEFERAINRMTEARIRLKLRAPEKEREAAAISTALYAARTALADTSNRNLRDDLENIVAVLSDERLSANPTEEPKPTAKLRIKSWKNREPRPREDVEPDFLDDELEEPKP